MGTREAHRLPERDECAPAQVPRSGSWASPFGSLRFTRNASLSMLRYEPASASMHCRSSQCDSPRALLRPSQCIHALSFAAMRLTLRRFKNRARDLCRSPMASLGRFFRDGWPRTLVRSGAAIKAALRLWGSGVGRGGESDQTRVGGRWRSQLARSLIAPRWLSVAKNAETVNCFVTSAATEVALRLWALGSAGVVGDLEVGRTPLKRLDGSGSRPAIGLARGE